MQVSEDIFVKVWTIFAHLWLLVGLGASFNAYLKRVPTISTGNLIQYMKTSVKYFRGPRVAVITAALGNSERTTKLHVPQTLPADFFCFTDYRELINTGNWTLDFTPYDRMNLTELDNGQWPNSRSKNNHPYMTYKFYKMQFHRIPCLSGYDLIVWIDMTVLIRSPYAIAAIWDVFGQFPDRSIFIKTHPTASRHGTIRAEMEVSVRDYRWHSNTLRGITQPFQDVRGQYNYYISQNYSQDYWAKENLSYFAGHHTGLWHTNIIAYKMKDPMVRKLLDAWYLEILRWTTQDQVSFPYVIQRLNIYPISAPTKAFNHAKYFRSVGHGH
jgi:hypothetical protein